MEWMRDRYLDYMAGRRVDRPMFVELFGPLVGLPEQWRDQGATKEEIELTSFGFDYVRRHDVDVNTGYYPHAQTELIEECEEYLTQRDYMGRVVKLPKGKATIALPLDYPVKDERDWLRVKDRYGYSQSRFTAGWDERARSARADNALITVSIQGGYDGIRQLMGDEEACVSFYTQPELVRDMLATFTELNRQILSRVAQATPIDQLSIHEDFAGKSGPLLGPNLMDEFIAPYYKDAWTIAHGGGAELFQLDSDGNITPIIDSLLAGGVNSILPNEPAAGMDIVALRKTYGSRLKLVGGLDKFAVRSSRQAIDRELNYKLAPLMREGGVVFGLDHRIPDGTPLENYRYYVRQASQMLGLPPDREAGWARMAF
jgi:uroporphyrinogen-III decarboxylase